MASYTSNYNLKKPEGTDFINVQDLNDNADLIDTAILAEKTAVQTWSKDTFSNPPQNINGDFQVWQRGTSFSGNLSAKYTADRWVFLDYNHSAVVTRLTEIGGLKYTATPNGSLVVLQNLMPSAYFKDKTVTISIKVKAITGTARLALSKASSYSALSEMINVDIDDVGIYNVSGICASTTYSIISLSVALTNTSNIEIEWIKLELGAVATPFVPRLYDEELELCKRYYNTFVSSGTNIILVHFGKVGTGITYCSIMNGSFTVEMRATPTVTTTDNVLKTYSGTSTGLTVNLAGEASTKGLHKLTVNGTLPDTSVLYLLLGTISFDAEIY